MTTTGPSIHASAVLVGARAVLIRGPSGSGKSRLALALLQAVPVARLVGDDRVHLEVHHGRLLVRPAKTLTGLFEVRGLGLRRLSFEPVAVVSLAVDLAIAHAERLPEANAGRTTIEGIVLPRLAVAPGIDPLPIVLASLGTSAFSRWPVREIAEK